MSAHNFEVDNSGLHALSKLDFASSPGSKPSDDAAAHSPNSPTTVLVVSTSDDIFEVLRLIQCMYGSGGSESSDRALSASGNSESDGGVDYETLREIQRRFRQYAGLEEDGDGNKQADDVRGKHNSNSRVFEITGATDRKEAGLRDHATDEGEKRISLSRKTAESVLAFIHAIGKNRSAQKLLRNAMSRVEERMQKLKKITSMIRVFLKSDPRLRKAGLGNRDKLISACNGSAKGAMKYGPQENSRMVNHRLAFQKYPQCIPRAKWTKVDRTYLQIGVMQQFQKSSMLKTINQGSEAEASGPVAMVGGDQVNLQALKSFLPNIDWDELASSYLPRRSGPECRTRWINHEDPSINREQWIREEDAGIAMHVRRNGFNWIAIADALGTNRTPFACLARYQRSLNPHLTKSEWTRAEDAELTAAVERYGESNWTVVSAALEGRTAPQCSNRWLKALLPSKQKKGRWERHEDLRLEIAVRLIGKCWNKIAEFVPGRTQASCRDRWVNCLDPSVNLGKWTEEEDRMLEEGIRVHGYSWSKVASCIPHRTDSQCRRRWVVLFPEDAVQVRTRRKLRKAMLPSNFVDREAHRPTLEASDFLGLALEGGVDDDDDNLTLAELKRSLKRRKR